MADNQESEGRVLLDLNNEVFQECWFRLEKAEQQRGLDTLKKIAQLSWDQVYRDQGLKWEKVGVFAAHHALTARDGISRGQLHAVPHR